MRELKFRVWDKWIKKYTHNSQVFDSFTEKLSRPDEFIIEQFTGLQDSECKDIYENDVYLQAQQHYLIQFVEGAFCITVIKDGILLNGASFILSHFPLGEVVGNINENPELLK